MPAPVAYTETIMKAVIAALEGISQSAGYNHDVKAVNRYDRFERDLEPPSIEIWFAGEKKENPGEEAKTQWDSSPMVSLAFLIRQRVDESEVTTDELVLQAVADVEKAVLSVDWDSLEAYPDGFDHTPLWVQDKEESYDGIATDIEIRYEADFDDPTTVLTPYK